MKRWPVVFVITSMATAAMAADASVSELAPPGTKVAAGINIRGLLDSPMAKDLGVEKQTLATMLAANSSLATFNPLQDLDRVWIFTPKPDDQTALLVILRGRFDAEKLAPGAKRYRDVPVLEDAKNAGAALAIIDNETAIAGTQAQVQAAIDRRGSGAQPDGDLMSQIDVAWSRYDVWGVGNSSEGFTQKGDASGLGSIDRFSFGAAIRQGLEVTAEIHASSPKDVAQLATVLNMLEMAIVAKQPKDSGTKFDMKSENGTFRISVTVPEKELLKAIQEQRAAMMSGVSKGVKAGTDARKNSGNATKPGTAGAPLLRATIPPAPPAAIPQLQPGAKAVVNTEPKPATKISISGSETKTQIVTAPDGDTVVVKLPGAK
jgi:hypothetical protein